MMISKLRLCWREGIDGERCSCRSVSLNIDDDYVKGVCEMILGPDECNLYMRKGGKEQRRGQKWLQLFHHLMEWPKRTISPIWILRIFSRWWAPSWMRGLNEGEREGRWRPIPTWTLATDTPLVGYRPGTSGSVGVTTLSVYTQAAGSNIIRLLANDLSRYISLQIEGSLRKLPPPSFHWKEESGISILSLPGKVFACQNQNRFFIFSTLWDSFFFSPQFFSCRAMTGFWGGNGSCRAPIFPSFSRHFWNFILRVRRVSSIHLL